MATHLFSGAILVQKLSEERNQLRSDLTVMIQQHKMAMADVSAAKESAETAFRSRERRLYQIAAFIAGVCLAIGFLIAWKILR